MILSSQSTGDKLEILLLVGLDTWSLLGCLTTSAKLVSAYMMEYLTIVFHSCWTLLTSRAFEVHTGPFGTTLGAIFEQLHAILSVR